MFPPLWFPVKVELSRRLGSGLVPSSSGCTGDAPGQEGCCAFCSKLGIPSWLPEDTAVKKSQRIFWHCKRLGTKAFIFIEGLSCGFMTGTCLGESA